MGFYAQAMQVAKQYSVATQPLPVQQETSPVVVAIPVQPATASSVTPTPVIVPPSVPLLSGGSSQSTFSYSLKQGTTDSAVKSLQSFLNGRGFIVTENGAGSPGHETDYFGPLTKAALMKFQATYKKQALDPQGLTVPTGFFGIDTMKLVNSLAKPTGN